MMATRQQMAPPQLAPSRRDIAESYRKLATKCREIAKRDPKPGPLLLRAAALDATADYVEQRAQQEAALELSE